MPVLVAVVCESNRDVVALKCTFKRTIIGIPAAVKSLLASSSTIPTIRNPKVAVVAIAETLRAELERPVSVEPERDEVPSVVFAKTAA